MQRPAGKKPINKRGKRKKKPSCGQNPCPVLSAVLPDILPGDNPYVDFVWGKGNTGVEKMKEKLRGKLMAGGLWLMARDFI